MKKELLCADGENRKRKADPQKAKEELCTWSKPKPGFNLHEKCQRVQSPSPPYGSVAPFLVKNGHPVSEVRSEVTQLLETMNYNATGEIPSQDPGSANLLTKISRMPRKKVIYQDGSISRAAKMAMYRLEQKKMSWMRELVRNFGKADDLMVDFCAGIYCTASAFMLLDQRRNSA